MFKEVPIGNITITGYDFPWTYGTFTKYAEYERYKDFFEFIVSEDSIDGDEQKFDEELFEENNWNLKNGSEIISIGIPAIYDKDNEISFRHR